MQDGELSYDQKNSGDSKGVGSISYQTSLQSSASFNSSIHFKILKKSYSRGWINNLMDLLKKKKISYDLTASPNLKGANSGFQYFRKVVFTPMEIVTWLQKIPHWKGNIPFHCFCWFMPVNHSLALSAVNKEKKGKMKCRWGALPSTKLVTPEGNVLMLCWLWYKTTNLKKICITGKSSF